MILRRTHRHRRHATVYIDRGGAKAIVVAQHYNGGPGGVLIEDDQPTVLGDLEDDLALSAAIEDALVRSQVRPERDLRSMGRSDWPAYKASRASSMRAFEASFIRLSISGANEANIIFEIEGMPVPDPVNHELHVVAYAGRSLDMGRQCLRVWRACRDRSL
jgi:hypothetical protein